MESAAKLNYYEILGVPRGEFRPDVIKRAYRRQAAKHHPDSTHRHATRSRKAFEDAKEAHDVLLDPVLRALHNKELEERGETDSASDTKAEGNSGSGDQSKGEEGSGQGDQASGNAGSSETGETGGNGETSGGGAADSDSGTKGKAGTTASGINTAPFPKNEHKEGSKHHDHRHHASPRVTLESRTYSFFQFPHPKKYTSLRDMHITDAPRPTRRRDRHHFAHLNCG